MNQKDKAETLLKEWKGDTYVYGQGVLNWIPRIMVHYDTNVLIVSSNNAWAKAPLETIVGALKRNNVKTTVVLAAKPNCPREDLYRIALQIAIHKPGSVIALGGGSTIDCVKAASVLATYRPNEVRKSLDVEWDAASTIDPYFGAGMVSRVKEVTGRDIVPVVAVQTAASSAAHLTKYSNITDPIKAQKKLIIDDVIVPKVALFDYGLTAGSPRSLTLDGGLDGIAHSWEVLMGATGKDNYDKIKEVAITSIELIVENLKTAIDNPSNPEARTAIGLGTDLGGYAIMLGGTNGGHLGSFSLVDVMTHGRACGILNPYYTIFFATSIQDQLKAVGTIFKNAGFIKDNFEEFTGHALGEAVARGMIGFAQSLGIPTNLREAGVKQTHLERMLTAAKNPQLRMKLTNMPVPLDPDKGDIETYMKSVLTAAWNGDLTLLKTR